MDQSPSVIHWERTVRTATPASRRALRSCCSASGHRSSLGESWGGSWDFMWFLLTVTCLCIYVNTARACVFERAFLRHCPPSVGAGSTTCHCAQKVAVHCSAFDSTVWFTDDSLEGQMESPGNHFIAGHFPNDKDWRWDDESWNDMILVGDLEATRRKTGFLCLAAVSVLPEPWNNDPSLFINVYLVNHNTSEMSLAFRRRTIDLVCALPHQRAVTGLHPNWGN